MISGILVHRLSVLAVLALFLTVSACAWLPKEEDGTKHWSAKKFYTEARLALEDGDYEQAIKYFEMLEARHPFGRYTQQAQLEAAYAYYKYNEPDSAIAAADRFIKMHPRHPHVDYAYYLKGLANFNRGSSFFDRFLPVDPAKRDTSTMRRAFFDFAELVKKFPKSKYAQDARQRMIFLRNSLARHEIQVAEYYMKRGAYIAAVNRAKHVIEHYQRTPAVPEALAILVRAYRILGLDTLANDALRVLKLNFPDHPLIAQAKTRSGG